MESKASMQGGDKDHAVVGQTKKGRGKGLNSSLRPKQLSSQDFGGQEIRGGIHRCEAGGESFPNLWLSSLHLRTSREEDQMEPSNRKGLFVGYIETSEANKIYIPGERKTIVSKDVKFGEDFASKKSHKPIPVIEDEEQESTKV